ncbi:MAG: acyltransferase [Opitutaceae bacterium]
MKRNLEVIQVFRGIAAVAVVLHHASLGIQALPGFTATSRPFFVERFFNADVGAVGVDLFFVISGFIMSYTARRGGLHQAREFLVRRAVRIYPLYWLCSLVMIAVLVSPWVQGFHAQPLALFQSFVLYPTLYEQSVRPVILAQGWTLIYEVLFYLIFALTLWQTRVRQCISVLGALALLFTFAHLLPGLHPVLVLLRDQVLFEFVFGLVLGLIITETAFRFSAPAAWVVIGAGLLLLAPSAFHDGYGWQIPRLWKFGVPAFLLIGGSVLRRDVESLRFPSALGVMGDASYSIYLMHVVVFLLCHTARLRLHFLQTLPFDVYFLLLSGCAVAIGVVFHFVAEKPLIRYCRNLVEPRANRPVYA